MYLWIKAAFQHFFNNVQKDPAVAIRGLRACRELLAYLLREVALTRQRLLDGLDGRRHPAHPSRPLPVGPIRAGRAAARRPRSAAGQRPAHRRERDGHHGRRGGRPGRSDLPRDRFADPPAGRRVCHLGTRRLPLRQLCRGQGAGPQRPGRRQREESRGVLYQLFPGSAAAAAARRSAAAQVRARRRTDRGRPAARGRHPGVRFARLGHEGRAGARRLHPRSAARALLALRLEPAHLPRPARVAGHHRRVDDCAAGAAGSAASRARRRASRRFHSSAASAASSWTTRISTRRRSRWRLQTPERHVGSGPRHRAVDIEVLHVSFVESPALSCRAAVPGRGRVPAARVIPGS